MTTDLTRIARTTGALYLALGISGMLGFLVVRGMIHVPGDAAATVANMIDNQQLVRLGIAAELTVVASQALVALWFYRLFRGVGPFAAGALAAFGMVNAIAVLVATTFTATALASALDSGIAPAGDAAATTLLMYELNGALWQVGGLFFGLWLLPMGYLVLTSGYLPRPLGYLLVAGGIGYIVATYLTYLWPSVPAAIVTGPPFLAAAGEFWIIGYLLTIGVRKGHSATPVAAHRS